MNPELEALADKLRRLEHTFDENAIQMLGRGPVIFDGIRYWINDHRLGTPNAVDILPGGGLRCATHDDPQDRCVAVVLLSRLIQVGSP